MFVHLTGLGTLQPWRVFYCVCVCVVCVVCLAREKQARNACCVSESGNAHMLHSRNPSLYSPCWNVFSRSNEAEAVELSGRHGVNGNPLDQNDQIVQIDQVDQINQNG